MMYFLNRLRGEYSYFAEINAVLLGVLFGLVSQNYYVGIAVAVGYIAGESMAWGRWIGQQCGSPLECGDEGEKNGIKWLASKFYPCGTDQYNRLALIIRGIYWWILTLIPLMFVMNPLFVLLGIFTLGLGFQISLDLALGNGKAKWEHAETIYGGIQDIVILFLLINIWIS